MTAEPDALRLACEGIADDYMTSEAHHPNHVLIPTAKFNAIVDALAASPAVRPSAQGLESGGEVERLRVLLDNLVIAQTLSREIRQSATDEARSYLYQLRQAALSPQPGPASEGEV